MAYSNFYARFYTVLDKIKASLAAIFHFTPSWTYLALIIIWQIIAWLQAWSIRRNLSGDILVLHYNVDFGIDLVGNPARIYLYPLLGLGVFFVNLIVLAALHKDKHLRIFIHFLFGATILFSLFLSIALLAIYLINFR